LRIPLPAAAGAEAHEVKRCLAGKW
jgi:hypothetical protein